MKNIDNMGPKELNREEGRIDRIMSHKKQEMEDALNSEDYENARKEYEEYKKQKEQITAKRRLKED